MAQRGPGGRNGNVTEKCSETYQEGAGKVPRLTLRAGIWYAGETRCKNYREALKKVLSAAEIAPNLSKIAKVGGANDFSAIPKSARPPKQKQYPRPERLETRPWWQQFLKEREAREEAREIREAALREQKQEQRHIYGRSRGAGA
jgi:hypothetical protein